MCSLRKDDFCFKAPVFVGDILWEHLQLLQAECDKDKYALRNAAPKLSEISTAPSISNQSAPTYTQYSSSRTYTNLDTSAPRYQSEQIPPRATEQQFSRESEQRMSSPNLDPSMQRISPGLEQRNSPIPPNPIKIEYPVKAEYPQYPYHQYQYSRMYQYPTYPTYVPTLTNQTYFQEQTQPNRWNQTVEPQPNYQVTVWFLNPELFPPFSIVFSTFLLTV